jgi:CBS domain-containing protein
MGVFSFVSGALIAGVWWFLLGMFLRGAANMSMQQVLLRQSLSGEPVSRFMTTDPMTVAPDTTVRELVEDFIYKRQHKLYPVMEDGRLVGCVTLGAVRQVDPERWGEVTVEGVMAEPSDANTISPDADAMDALQRLNATESSRLMVVDGDGNLVGVIALKDLLGFFSMKVDLESK